MTNEELDAIEARVNAATPGPWLSIQSQYGVHIESEGYVVIARMASTEADGFFIIEARNALPALLAEVRRLQTENANLRAVLSGELVTAAERDSLRAIMNRIEKSLSGDPEVES